MKSIEIKKGFWEIVKPSGKVVATVCQNATIEVSLLDPDITQAELQQVIKLKEEILQDNKQLCLKI